MIRITTLKKIAEEDDQLIIVRSSLAGLFQDGSNKINTPQQQPGEGHQQDNRPDAVEYSLQGIVVEFYVVPGGKIQLIAGHDGDKHKQKGTQRSGCRLRKTAGQVTRPTRLKQKPGEVMRDVFLQARGKADDSSNHQVMPDGGCSANRSSAILQDHPCKLIKGKITDCRVIALPEAKNGQASLVSA